MLRIKCLRALQPSPKARVRRRAAARTTALHSRLRRRDHARPCRAPSLAAAPPGSRHSGWVENRLSMRAPDSGLTMNRCAEAGLRSASMLGMRFAAPAIFCRAEASDSGRRLISAPARSASYSRVRLIAICTRPAASGPRIERAASVPIKADIAVVVAAAAETEAEIGEHRDRAGDRRGDGHQQRVAVLDVAELVRDHAGELVLVDGVEQAGGDRDGGVLRDCGPVANAFGCGFSMMKTRGIGRPAAAASCCTSA